MKYAEQTFYYFPLGLCIKAGGKEYHFDYGVPPMSVGLEECKMANTEMEITMKEISDARHIRCIRLNDGDLHFMIEEVENTQAVAIVIINSIDYSFELDQTFTGQVAIPVIVLMQSSGKILNELFQDNQSSRIMAYISPNPVEVKDEGRLLIVMLLSSVDCVVGGTMSLLCKGEKR